MTRVTVLPGPERRRRWTPAEKHRIVEESLAAEASVVEVARRHDIHPNLLHLWRRQLRSGTVTSVGRPSDALASKVQFATVAIAADERVSAPDNRGRLAVRTPSQNRTQQSLNSVCPKDG